MKYIFLVGLFLSPLVICLGNADRKKDMKQFTYEIVRSGAKMETIEFQPLDSNKGLSKEVCASIYSSARRHLLERNFDDAKRFVLDADLSKESLGVDDDRYRKFVTFLLPDIGEQGVISFYMQGSDASLYVHCRVGSNPQQRDELRVYKLQYDEGDRLWRIKIKFNSYGVSEAPSDGLNNQEYLDSLRLLAKQKEFKEAESEPKGNVRSKGDEGRIVDRKTFRYDISEQEQWNWRIEL